MIENEQELEATLERIRHFQAQLKHLRRMESNATNYRLSASGFIAEIDRMQLEVREYLSSLPSQVKSPKTRSSCFSPLPSTGCDRYKRIGTIASDPIQDRREGDSGDGR